MHDHNKALEVFRNGTAIPATPLALTEDRKFDEATQRLLMRYYLNAGAGGIATAVHSTQFAIRDCGLFEPVISIVSEEVDKYEQSSGRSVIKVCGACGRIEQAVREAEIAKLYGFDAVLLSPGGLGDVDEAYMIERTKAVAKVLPVIGFYLQSACGGRVFSYDYWRQVADTDNVIGIKCASFNRYTTNEVVRAVCNSPRRDQISLYTGNDDNIVSDLVSTFTFQTESGVVSKGFVGGLLGHWCIWTKCAVELLQMAKEAKASGDYSRILALGPQITDMNEAAFDPKNGFKGCIPGIHEVLRRQGLMKNIYCLDEKEVLSVGQSEELTRVIASYPHLIDDDFIAANIETWKRQA
ncbi:MAG: dihydrodipicolinate synthase family protein [Sphaerochaetaceae bacterium]|nr:dihydrodipicolinate synthase family protein [Sphaerochaetaceae bacterium]